MARIILDFGSANGGANPAPSFTWFRDAITHAALAPPLVVAEASPAWTYFFDYNFPVANSQNTNSVEYGISQGGVGRTGTVLQPGLQATRTYLDFGSGNGGLTPPTFTWYRDLTTKAAIVPPAVFVNASPAWNYFFDAVFPAGTTVIEYGLTLAGVNLTGTITAPILPAGFGGANTLLGLRNLIRQESDTENDPHISDSELTGWINQSYFRLYAKLVTSFGDDYFNAKAQIPTDGINSEFALPNGTLYGGAPPVFKSGLLEAIQGFGVQPNAPVVIEKFNMRQKNRYQRPLSLLVTPGFLPRARIIGNNLVFVPQPVPAGAVFQLWYAPRLAPLVNDTDVADDWNGWLELVVVDCVIKAIGKQQMLDPSLFVARKSELLAELNQEVANRDMGEPNTVAETATEGFGPFAGVPGGVWGGGVWW